MGQVKQRILDDAGYFALIIAYAAATLAAALILGDAKWFNPFVYASRWASGIGLVCCAVVGLSMWRARGATDFVAATADELKKFATPDAMSGLLLFFCIGLFYGTFTSAKAMMPQFVPFLWDHTFAEIDATLHGADPWIYLQWLQPFDSLVRTFYFVAWGTFLTSGTLMICVTNLEFRRQYLWTFFICWIVLGTIVPLMFMAGGPIYFEGLTGDTRFSELSDRLLAHADPTDPSAMIPQNLWNAFVNNKPGFGSGISAFPSLHVSMATLFALAAFRLNRSAGLLMTAYLLFVVVGSVHLGWHYAVDGYFSIAVTVILWKCVGLKLSSARLRSGVPMRSAIPAEGT